VTVLQDLRVRYEPQLRRVFHLYWRLVRSMTLGVRAVVLDADNKVFLVKHSYVSGWHLPGGGVEVGETLLHALTRELMEEGRIELAGEPVLHGVFLNNHVSRRDHVAVYVIRQFRQDRLPEPNRASSIRPRCPATPRPGPGCGSPKCSAVRRRWPRGASLGLC
jgi:ADP-ribose pyrophosphatase YjhB (NUDIX family)